MDSIYFFFKKLNRIKNMKLVNKPKPTYPDIKFLAKVYKDLNRF